jgi:eukaryotic-like serine/threonine-protein kinase
MSLASGSRVGPYEVLAQIGAGGMGEVYRARDTKLNRDVALKILPEAFTLDGDRVARFRREAQVLASLNHPNIAAIYGFEDSGSTHALVLELVEGPTLADRIAKGPIPLDEALPIAKQIAEALEAAHEQGIIHRDLKPANIKVRDDGTVKVLDFGLAKAMEPASAISPALTASPTITTPAQMTGVGMILGTAAYMSPEQAKGRPADKRSDIWAFGCVLFEMLTGKRAFDGEDVSDTLAAVLRGEPEWTALPAETPRVLRTLIERCLSRDRRQRIADMSVALFVVSEPLERGRDTGKASRSQDVTPISASRWTSWIALVVAVLVTAAIVAGGAWSLRPSTAAPPIARFSLPLAEGQVLAATGRLVMAISPDASELVYIANNRIYLRSLSEFDAHPISGGDGTVGSATAIHTPAFSPDGRFVAFYSAGDAAIKRVPVGGGAAINVCPAATLFGMTWDASGIVFAQSQKGVFRCSPNGGAPEQLAAVKNDEVPFRPQLLPGGAALLFTLVSLAESATEWDKARIVVETLATHQRKTLVNGSDGRYVPSGHLLYALGGIVFAVGFDPARQTIQGGPVPVIEGVRRAITTTGTAQFATSDTGALMYLSGPIGTTRDEWAIGLADRTGAVTRISIPPGPYAHVRASRDGARVTIGSDDAKEANVWVYDLQSRSAIRRLTFGGKNRFPIWSPDGSRVAFQSDREGDAGIFVQHADGTGVVERLTRSEAGEVHVPESWSPDGRFISYSSVKGSAHSLWTVSIADKKTAPFGGVRSVEPIGSVFSPDGRWVAYTSTPSALVGAGRSPDRGIFVQPFPPTGARYQIPVQQVDFHPVWGPKGNELIYVPSAASGQLAVVGFATQPTVTFGSPVTLQARVTGNRTSGRMRAYDVLPDGRLVGLVQPTEPDSTGTTAPQIRVALNWFEELKQRVPTK